MTNFQIFFKSYFSKSIILLCFLFFIKNVNGQDGLIRMVNASFEGINQYSTCPPAWQDCGGEMFLNESPPNTHPIANQPFGVTQQAAHKFSYLGMVVRENETWESISNKLVEPMEVEQCYIFKIKMCHSKTFKSPTRSSSKGKVSFTEPIVLKIWGAKNYCDKVELLATSPLVDNSKWKDFVFMLQPEFNHEYIILEAFVGDEKLKFPNGNILLDDASPLIPVACDMEESELEDFEWMLYDLNLENIKTEEGLHLLVLEEGLHLVFNYKGGLTEAAQNDLSRIVKVMKKYPNHKLVFLFEGERKKRIKALENEFTLLGFPEKQYELRKRKRADKKKDWLIKGDRFYVMIEQTIF